MFQQLKKSHFRYARCQGGGMHDGEILNLVCVDERCLHRGLVCPVCKMQTHDDHYILPIKTFLGQIRDLFDYSSDESEPNNLGDYLRAIETTKRELLKDLRDQISQLSTLLKQMELKIESSYLSVRRNVLIQSSLTTKLPSLITLLTSLPTPDPADLQNQFKKYCELIKYRDGKIKLADKANLIVDIYRRIPSKLKTQTLSSLTAYRTHMLEASKVLDLDSIDKELQKKSKGFKFSPIDKHRNIKVNTDCKEAELPDIDPGLVMVDSPFTTAQSELVFTVLKNNSFNILVGIGSLTKIKASNFENREEIELYIVSNGETSVNQQYSEEEDETKYSFEFGEGDRISVKIVWDRKVCLFTHLTTNKTHEIPLKSTLADSNFRLCFGLGSYDSVKIQ